MKVVIRSNDFKVTDSLRTFLNEQVQKSMSVCSRNIELITIRLKDINGPKGGVDKECIVEIKIANQPSVVVKKRNSNAYRGIRHAITRAARISLRKLRKRQNQKNSAVVHKALATMPPS